MNILMITPLYPPAPGGAATYFWQIVPRLAKYDEVKQITVLTESMPGQPSVQVDGKIQLLRRLPNRISSRHKPFLLHAATYILTQMWFAFKLQTLVRHYSVDVIHFHTSYRGRVFYNALRRTRIPVIADLRDKMTDPLPLQSTVRRLLCCGEGVYNFVIKSGFPSEQVTLIPNVFTPPERPSAAMMADVQKQYALAHTRYLLYVGDITFNKGVYDLMSAYKNWHITHPEVALILVGANREGQKFWQHLQQTPGAIYLGHLPHQEVLTLMCGADIVILPSRSEGLPTVILEAVAMGTKVICPPDIPEFDRHLAEFVLPEVCVASIVETLNRVWHHPSRPEYPFAEHHVDRVGEALMSLYITVCHC